MAAELAVIGLLKQDQILQGFIGNNPPRVFPFQIPENTTLPSLIVRSTSLDANDTKDGPSGLDVERVQVLMYSENFNTSMFLLEQRVREILDRSSSGFVNGVDLESSSLEDRDTFREQLLDRDVFVVENIYKCLIKR